MSTIEDRVRSALHDIADEARPAPLLQRMEHTPVPRRLQHPTALPAAVASVLVAVLVTASVILARADHDAIIEPARRPPKVLHLLGGTSAAPGRAELLVVLADPDAPSQLHEKPAYLLPVGSSRVTQLEEPPEDSTWTEHLSLDGTRVIREVSSHQPGFVGDNWLEIVDLRTGAATPVERADGSCPALSPDNRTVALNRDEGVALVDVRTGRDRALPQGVPWCGGLAWTPDGSGLVVRGGRGSLLMDRSGEVRTSFPGLYPVNGSSSWSPDGRRLLLYDPDPGRYVARDVAGGHDQVLARPADARKPVGWAGSRIVWLAGPVGDERLVTTDGEGSDTRPWTRLRTRGMPVESVSWSQALRGSARD